MRSTLPPVQAATFLAATVLVACSNHSVSSDPSNRIARPGSGVGSQFAYIANYGVVGADDGDVSAYDIGSGRVTSIRVGSHPIAIALNPSESRAYVANYYSGNVSVIDTSTNNVITTIPVGGFPLALAFNASGTAAFVVNSQEPASVSVIDLSTNRVTSTFSIVNSPISIALNPKCHMAYITEGALSSVWIYDTDNGALTGTINIDSRANGAYGVAVNSTGTLIYVADEIGQKVVVIDAKTNKIITSVGVTAFPDELALTPDGKKLYVADQAAGMSNDNVTVIDTTTNSISTVIPVGASSCVVAPQINPFGIAVNSAGTLAYVTLEGQSSFDTIGTATDNIVNNICVGTHPFSVAAP